MSTSDGAPCRFRPDLESRQAVLDCVDAPPATEVLRGRHAAGACPAATARVAALGDYQERPKRAAGVDPISRPLAADKLADETKAEADSMLFADSNFSERTEYARAKRPPMARRLPSRLSCDKMRSLTRCGYCFSRAFRCGVDGGY
jgi:hypothetical protein